MRNENLWESAKRESHILSTSGKENSWDNNNVSHLKQKVFWFLNCETKLCFNNTNISYVTNWTDKKSKTPKLPFRIVVFDPWAFKKKNVLSFDIILYIIIHYISYNHEIWYGCFCLICFDDSCYPTTSQFIVTYCLMKIIIIWM